jgi:hypothetical protein
VIYFSLNGVCTHTPSVHTEDFNHTSNVPVLRYGNTRKKENYNYARERVVAAVFYHIRSVNPF